MSDLAPGDAIRLDVARALPRFSATFTETGPAHRGAHRITTRHLLTRVGDPVLARPRMAASYHLSVVVDDAAQGITHVIRGEDLFEAAALHTALHSLLETRTPVFHHHRLIRDDTGKRLAKRDDARAIRTFRDDGVTPAEIRAMVGL
jgi:glutamyl-Q tRNA(Asp) synthetase